MSLVDNDTRVIRKVEKKSQGQNGGWSDDKQTALE